MTTLPPDATGKLPAHQLLADAADAFDEMQQSVWIVDARWQNHSAGPFIDGGFGLRSMSFVLSGVVAGVVGSEAPLWSCVA